MAVGSVIGGGSKTDEFHVGDVYRYTMPLSIGGLNTTNNAWFAVFLPKPIGSDVKTVEAKSSKVWYYYNGYEGGNGSSKTFSVQFNGNCLSCSHSETFNTNYRAIGIWLNDLTITFK